MKNMYIIFIFLMAITHAHSMDKVTQLNNETYLNGVAIKTSVLKMATVFWEILTFNPEENCKTKRLSSNLTITAPQNIKIKRGEYRLWIDNLLFDPNLEGNFFYKNGKLIEESEGFEVDPLIKR